jgi:hypothetical protein
VSWTDLLGLQDKNICKKAEVVPIALEIAKPAYGIILHSAEPEENTANKKKTLMEAKQVHGFTCRPHMTREGGRWYKIGKVRITLH